MLKEHPHTPESEAFAQELIELMGKYESIPAIHMTAMLAQFAGQTGAYALVQEGYNEYQVMEVVATNSSKNFNDQLKAIESQSPCGVCPACIENGFGGKPN